MGGDARRHARERLDAVCREADRLRADARDAAEQLRVVRQRLTAARIEQEEAQAGADVRRVAQSKTEARRAYRRALAAAVDATDRQLAAAAWLQAINRINAASRAAMGSLVSSQARSIALEQRAEAAQLAFDAKRIKAEAAEAACADARSDVAERDNPAPAHAVPFQGAGA
jgi:hypothetical protein